jgi:hypothetical protein
MNYEWGPWVEHDGKGCPADVSPGVRVMVEYRNGQTHGGVVNSGVVGAGNWVWPKRYGLIFPADCIRYRVRRPLVSEWLAETTSDLPVREDA